MKEECLLCGAPLEYLTRGRKMECALCHKKSGAKPAVLKGISFATSAIPKGLTRSSPFAWKPPPQTRLRFWTI